MTSLKYDIPVSFAFLTAPSLRVCVSSAHHQVDAEIPHQTSPHYSRSDPQPGERPLDAAPTPNGLGAPRAADSVATRAVTIKHIHHAHLLAETRTFFLCGDRGTMSTIYDQLHRDCSQGEDVVCFTVTLIGVGDKARAKVDHIVHSHDAVPSLLFCQTLRMLRSPSSHVSHFVCVHFLVFTASGALCTAQLPCLVPIALPCLSADAISVAVTWQLEATPAEVEYLRACPLVRCAYEGGTLMIAGDIDAAHGLPQLHQEPIQNRTPQEVALLLPLLSLGDVVRVDARAHKGTTAIQGIVARTTVSDGRIRYDVLDVDSNRELAAQACTRVVPL